MQAYWPLYPMNNLTYIKSIITHSLKLQYHGFRCHFYILVKPVLMKTTFKNINSIRRHHIIRPMYKCGGFFLVTTQYMVPWIHPRKGILIVLAVLLS